VLSAGSQSHRLTVSGWFYSRYCAINQQADGVSLQFTRSAGIMRQRVG
jgi:hypothetical protein